MGLRNFMKRHSSDPLRRRKAWSKYFERRARRFDLHVYKSHLNWTISEDFKTLLDQWGDAPGIPADRCFFIYSLGKLISSKGISGDTAECGVRFGKSSFMLLNALADQERPHHLFDSFEGLSEPRAQDASIGFREWEEGEMSADESAALKNLSAFPNCVLHRGWIPDRFADAADRRFACVHIDVDLYDPTRTSLEFFYPRMAQGGFIVCDDYGLASCPGATKAFDEFFEDKPEMVLPIPSGQVLVWKT